MFDLQHALADAFGYKAQSTPEGKHKQRASEVLMRQYYWAAKAVTQLNQILLLNIEAHLQAQRGDLRIDCLLYTSDAADE